MKKMNKKGFTLMEMLIVIAIIAILIAIAIPTFTNALDKSRQRTDEANARSLKSLIATVYMSANPGEWNDTLAGTTFYLAKDGQTCGAAADLTISGETIAKIEDKATYTCKAYKATGEITGTCSTEGIVVVNCAAVPGGAAAAAGGGEEG